MKEVNLAIVTGYDSTKDKDAVGQYSEILYKHLVDVKPSNVNINYEVLRPESAVEWITDYYKLQKKYDLIHIQYPIESWGNSVMPGIYSVLPKYLEKGKKVVVTFHEWTSMHILRKSSIIPLAMLNDGIIFVSPSEQQRYKKNVISKIAKKKSSVIPIGANIKVPNLACEDIINARNKYLKWNGIEVDLLLGFFGFIYDWKQPYKMLSILKQLHDSGVSARLVMAGDFPVDHTAEKQKFIDKIHQLDLVDFVVFNGFVEDEKELATILSACNITLLLYSDGLTTRRSSFWYVLELGLPILTTVPENIQEFEDVLDLEQLRLENRLNYCSRDNDDVQNVVSIISRYMHYTLPQPNVGISPNWKQISEKHMEFYLDCLRMR